MRGLGAPLDPVTAGAAGDYDSRSITMAMPWPPPTHIVSRPNCLSWNWRLLIRVPVMRAPVIPNG